LKFPEANTDNLLDFGSVRVGDFADRTFSVKNTGLYRVKFSFVLKKRTTREMFRVEPMEVELDPTQVREVLVRFIATKELKLKTTNSNTDLIMEVLEGKTLELFKPVPINVVFNAVYSKYSIVPMKSINFGPIQFNEQKSRTLEVRNEG
jgi:hydrocephalus-inducing protein